MNYNKLSADPTALILGIIAFVIMILGFCCGLVVFVSLILGVVGLVLSIKSLKEYEANPTVYSHQSQQNVYVGKIICLITTILSTIYFIIVVFAVVFYQLSLSDLFKNKIEQIRNQEIKDSIYLDEEIEENYSNDSIYIDTTFVDSIKKEN
ncbi:CCC motif membrane protein [Flavobacterium sp.]|mgnify:CR=1 FL=1|uniref:CCC motif membrane protein n=1 Tax=Flavobacterium sp. TaxID=239 RepID=UPI002FDD1EB2